MPPSLGIQVRNRQVATISGLVESSFKKYFSKIMSVFYIVDVEVGRFAAESMYMYYARLAEVLPIIVISRWNALKSLAL